MVDEFNPSSRTEEALRHLKRLKPYDGWSVDIYLNSSGKRLVMLRRRNVPLGDAGFEDVVLDSRDTGCVVGITSYVDGGGGGAKKYGRGVVLVEKDGEVCGRKRDVRVTLPPDPTKSSSLNPSEEDLNKSRERMRADRERARRAVEGRSQSQPRGGVGGAPTRSDSVADAIAAVTRGETLTDGQNRTLITLGVGLIGATIVLKALASALFAVWILLFPLAFLYGVQTCPSNESFDAKKELKRVMRGANLPEDHPEKPKGWLGETIRRATASVTTELATSLGYEVSLWNIAGAFTIATVRVPSINADCYWVGAFGKWTYVLQREIPATTTTEGRRV